MDSGPTLKAKVAVKYNTQKPSPSRPPSRRNMKNIPSRPLSPSKSFVVLNSNIDPLLAFRPKAKVNGSATTRKVAAVRSTTPSASATPRSGSPTKLTPRVRNGVTSPTHILKVPSHGDSTLRSPPTVSAPVTPELRSRTETTAPYASFIGPQGDAKSRSGSVSMLHHAVSFSSFHPTPMTHSVSERVGTTSTASSPGLKLSGFPGNIDRETTSSPTLRIRSKVSPVAKSSESSLVSPTSGLSSTLVHPSTRSSELRARNASVSSQQQQQPPKSPPLQFYPITTATPAANPHRYASVRSPPPRTIVPTASQVFQSPAQRQAASKDGDSPPGASRNRAGVKINGIQAKVEPSAVAPLSPPMSAVSFSSRSSVSRSSASVSAIDDGRSEFPSTSAATGHPNRAQHRQNGNPDHLSSTLNNLIQYTSDLLSADETADGTEDESADEERKVKAAAKSNRKIADLEITNRSLLAINATLEATKHRQAKEIRELKRKLRESRLILPPRAYCAVKSSLDPSEVADDEEDIDGEEQDVEDERDEVYERIKILIDNLLKTGQRALEKQANDFPESGKGGAKVLTAEEVMDWHQGTDGCEHDNIHDDDEHHTQETGFDDGIIEQAVNKSLTASEAEVEAMTIPSDFSSSTPPPIFITKPS